MAVELNKNTIVKWDGIEVEVPANIINKELYAQWKVRDDRLRSREDRYLTISTGDKLDLMLPKGALVQKLNKLKINKTERTKILDKAFEFGSEAGQLRILKRRVNSLDGSFDQSPALELREAELIEMFGKFATESEVHKLIVQEWGYDISFHAVRKFAIKNKERILARQEEYQAEFDDIVIGSKRSRLGKLNYLLQDRLSLYEKSHKIDDSREIRAILADARKEVEGEVVKLDVSGKIDIEATLSVEHQEKVLKTLAIQQLVIGRVAARMNCNPLLLMTRLANSYYKKFNGFSRNDDLQNSKPLYPSAINYDFDEIAALNQNLEAKENKIRKDPEIQDAVIVEDVKSKLMKIIQQRKQQVDKQM